MPTEKDVQYYSELVRQEVADKTINSECMMRNIKWYIFPLGLWSFKKNDVWQDIVERNELPFSSSRRELCPQCEDIINQNQKKWIEIIEEILWHEVRLWDFLDWIEKNEKNRWFAISIQSNINHIYGECKRLPYSALPDSTKIELGKIVESIVLKE